MSPEFALEVAKTVGTQGIKVYLFEGLRPTPVLSFAIRHLQAFAGVVITASHNPPEYNGMKFVKRNSVPVGYDSGLNQVEKMILNNDLGEVSEKKGSYIKKDIMTDFISNLKNFYNAKKINPFTVVVNAGNGCAGLAINAIEKDLPIKMIKVFNEPDSDFPNGVPNPLLPENRQPTIDAVLKNKADLGVAWDGDYDRCFFFDEKGTTRVIKAGREFELLQENTLNDRFWASVAVAGDAYLFRGDEKLYCIKNKE